MSVYMDPEFTQATAALLDAKKSIPKLAVHDVEGRRQALAGFAKLLGPAQVELPDVQVDKFSLQSYDGSTVMIYRFFKKEYDTSAVLCPAILHSHGGGMIRGTVSDVRPGLLAQVSRTNVQIFSVDYRVAPEHKSPTNVEDCYAGLTWLHEHAGKFKIDPARIAVQGESAGGGIAAGVALLARDRKLSPPLAKQILIYPMLDDRNTNPIPGIDEVAVWNCEDNITGWTALLGDMAGAKEGVSYYAAPARVPSVDGLPSTYIDIGGVDIFRDETLLYVSRVAAANITTEFHMYPGVPHGFEMGGPAVSVIKRATENRTRAIMSF